MNWERKFDEEENEYEEDSQPRVVSWSQSYSSSTSCRPDPEDDEFLICKKKIS
jgi:hypothetical protein